MTNSKSSLIATLASLLIIFSSLNIQAAENQPRQNVWNDIKNDYSQFYSSDTFIRMGIVFTAGAAMANTSFDQDFQDRNKANIFSVNDSLNIKKLGEGKYLIPISLLAAGIGHYMSDGKELSGAGKWGELTARAYLVGGPTVLATQLLTGASRPSEAPYKSDWKPFNDSNGVSGHSFIGAVPFLTVAAMNDNLAVKTAAYLGSTLAGLSRINDNQHYLSQVVLGWYLAWESVHSVNAVETKKNNIRIMPMASQDSYGVQLSMQW